MQISELLQFFRKKWPILALFILGLAILAFVFSIVQPRRYRSDVRVLIVPNFSEEIDPYTASRSTEYLSNLLTEVMYSQSFFNKVIESGYGITTDLFPRDEAKQRQAWTKTLNTRVLGDTGIIDLSVYHTDRYTAEQLALAVTQVLTMEHSQYHSRGESLTVQTIDEAVTSNHPTEPNLWLNTLLGAILGLGAGLAFIYLFPRKEMPFNLTQVFDGEHALKQPLEPDWSKPVAVPMQEDMSQHKK